MDLNRLAAKIVRESTDPETRDVEKDSKTPGREDFEGRGPGDRRAADGAARSDGPQREKR